MSNMFRTSTLTLAVSMALGTFSTYTVAQEAAAEKDVEKIVVVGSRAAPRSIGDSAVPVDVIDQDEFVSQGSTDMVSMMQNVVPSFNVNDQPINDASTLVRPANLRGLASDHTLVLVNGKRRHRSAVITFLGGGLSDGAQGPDISTIPAIALKQVEVLRDGAAAQYGSDALAGVMNFVLNDANEGGMIEARTGSYFEGDGDMAQIAGNLGLAIGEDGFANLSMEYRSADDTSKSGSVQRDDAAAIAATGNPFVKDVAQVWGNPEVKYDFKFFGNFGKSLSDDSEMYAFTNFAEREVEGGFYYRNPTNRGGVNDGGTDADGNPLMLVGDLTPDDGNSCGTAIASNDFLNNDDFNAVSADPNCFMWATVLPGGFTPRFGGKVKDMSFTAGTKGEWDNGVNYDFSGQFGKNEVDFMIRNTINPSMGPDSPRSFKPGRYVQIEKSLNADFSKPMDVDGFDEPVNVAGGVEYREESYTSYAGDKASWEIGPLASQGFGIGSNGFPGLSERSAGKGERDSWAAYVDVEAYVNENLLVSGAIRHEDFSDFGGTTKGKIAARLQVNDEWAVRGAISTGFKAPTIGQINVRNVTTAFGTDGKLIDRATLPPTDPISVQKGGTTLTPEESVSYSFGMVGELENGLFVTVDFYNIEVSDRISTTSGIKLTEDDIASLLAAGVSDASSFTEVSYFTNDFDTTTKGVDIVGNYEMEMFGGDTKFSLAYNWTSTTVDKASDNISADRVRMLENNLPAVRYSLSANHTNGDLRLLTRLSYFGSIFEDHLDSGLPMNAGSEFTVDVEAGYQVTENINLIVGAKNLFDNKPDANVLYDTEVAGSVYPTTSPIGVNGGFYYVRGIYTF